MVRSGQIEDDLDKGDRPSFHKMAMDAGMFLFSKYNDLPRAYSYCHAAKANGFFLRPCLHGVLMEYFDTTSFDEPITAVKLASVCDELKKEFTLLYDDEYLECFHAVGHSLIAKQKGNLPVVLEECESILNSDSCKQSALHEYSRGESHLGRHSHSPLGTLFLPCQDLDARHKLHCYHVLGQRSQDFSGGKPLDQSYKLCLQIPAEYKEYCIEGLVGKMLADAVENPQKSVATCDKLEEIRNDCFEALVVVAGRVSGQALVRAMEEQITQLEPEFSSD